MRMYVCVCMCVCECVCVCMYITETVIASTIIKDST